MASMNEAEKDTSLNCAPNELNVPTTRSEAERHSHDKSIQTSTPASPENLRTLEDGEDILTQQGQPGEGSAVNPVVESKETEPQPSQQTADLPSSPEQQQSQQPLQQEKQDEAEAVAKPETKPEAVGGVASPENAAESSIGAAVEGQPSSSALPPQITPTDNDGPTLFLNILLTSGGKHPFKLDGKYLRKREVNVTDNDPFTMSVYTLKELIWREWRSGTHCDTTLPLHLTPSIDN
ncbi:hypothetical protein FQN49_002185 [Arthroderma sp. PD_2]|nr:hypothetical protein FQN49_002185 [Arthroderma sp. PD_2]